MKRKMLGSLAVGIAILGGSTFAQQPIAPPSAPVQFIQYQGKDVDGRATKSIVLDGATMTFTPVAQPPSEGGGPRSRGKGGEGGERSYGFSFQPPGGGGGDRGERGGGERGGRGGGMGGLGGMMGGDPNMMFNMISKGKDVINRDELDERMRPMFDRMAPMLGITNGQLSRAQFQQATESMRSRMQQGGGGMGGIMGGQGGGPGGGMQPEQMDRFAEDRFRRTDRDGDGLITPGEMSDRLKGVWEKFDTNKKGGMNLQDYKSYFREAFQQDQPATPTSAQPAAPAALPPPQDPGRVADDEDRKPIVYRAGRLPSDLPGWFEQLDTDRDGQVGLYEWVKGNRNLEEFKGFDRNEDSLITIEEISSIVRGNRPAGGSDAVAMANPGDSRGGAFGNMNMWGGRGGEGNAFGNFGNRGGGPGGRGNVNRGGDNGGGRNMMNMRGGNDNGGGGRGPGMRGTDNGGGGRGPGGRGGDNGGGGRGPGGFGNGGTGAFGGFGGGARNPGAGRNSGDVQNRLDNGGNPNGGGGERGGRGGRGGDRNNNNRPNP